jgi:hypothetical protein
MGNPSAKANGMGEAMGDREEVTRRDVPKKA